MEGVRMLKVSGCEVLARCLRQLGVSFVVGKDEGALGPVFKAMRETEGVTAITPFGDIAGPFMAYGNTYYRVFPAVILTSTPADAVNALTGAGTAWADKVPVMVVSACPDIRVAGSPAGRTQREFFSAFTKWSTTVMRGREIPQAVGQAFREAMGGCHGPVHIDVPVGLLAGEWEVPEAELDAMISRETSAQPAAVIDGDPALIEKALKMLLASERPLIFSGGGVVPPQARTEMDGRTAPMEERLIIFPYRCFFMCGTAFLHIRNAPFRLSASNRRGDSGMIHGKCTGHFRGTLKSAPVVAHPGEGFNGFLRPSEDRKLQFGAQAIDRIH
jgi:glyoxylate carboligase